MKNFFTVHEFAKITGIEASTLRFWDEIGVFSPIKRDPENNYRYYSLAQLTSVNFVSVLSDLQIPLKDIAKLRQSRDPKNLIKILEKREYELDMELRAIRLRFSMIHMRRELINQGLDADETKISIVEMDDRACILWPRNEYEEGDTFVNPLAALIREAKERQVNLDFPVGGYWDSLDSFKNAPSLPDHFYSIDPIGTHLRKGGPFVVGYARGDYGEMGDLAERMSSYIRENHITVSGPLYVIYLHDEICTKDPTQYIAQACIAVSNSKNTKKK